MKKTWKNMDKFVQKGMKTQRAMLRKVKENLQEIEELHEVEMQFNVKVKR
jgi:hypothetical protein